MVRSPGGEPCWVGRWRQRPPASHGYPHSGRFPPCIPTDHPEEEVGKLCSHPPDTRVKQGYRGVLSLCRRRLSGLAHLYPLRCSPKVSCWGCLLTLCHSPLLTPAVRAAKHPRGLWWVVRGPGWSPVTDKPQDYEQVEEPKVK